MVRDEFLREMKTPPHFWVGPELTRRIVRGQSPVLTSKQLREANSRDGLNLVCWEACIRPEYDANGEIPRYIMEVFIQTHRGYSLKEVISPQCDTPDYLNFMLRTGGYLWDPLTGAYTSDLREDHGEIVRRPHVGGITRDLERNQRAAWAGSWVGALFDYQPPRLWFSRNEQRLLTYALPGATDEQLAEMLGSSLPTVKKTWVSIYHRVEDFLPGLISETSQADTVGGRGREKRRRLLAYLREHPEELRPVSAAIHKKKGRA
jgi:hypothetical protein